MNQLFGFLFARPSSWEGVARALDLGATLQEYNSSLTPEQADTLALLADWRVIGDDLSQAMKAAAAENAQVNKEIYAQAQAALCSGGQLELVFTNDKS